MMRQQTILIVDDDTSMRLSLSLILQKEKYHVELAANADEALIQLGSHGYDLMFLDLNMPGMPGIELLAEVNKHHAQMPVLILTAHAALETAIQAVRLGARDYLIKPVEPVVLLSRVRELLAEGEGPVRKTEILSQMQNLLAELRAINGDHAALPDANSAHFLKKGNFELDLQAGQVTLNGNYLPVTGIYLDYLCTLLRHAPKPVDYRTLVKESQGYDVALLEAQDLARWRIHALRQAIEADPMKPKYLMTVRGIGYRLAI